MAIGVAIELVELVRAFVNDDVVAVALPAGRDLGQGQDQRPGGPGLAAAPVLDLVHHAGFVHLLEAAAKLVRVQHHGMPAAVPVKTQIEYRQRCLQGDGQRLRAVDGGLINGLQNLARQKVERKLLQPLPITGRPVGQHRHPGEGGRPVLHNLRCRCPAVPRQPIAPAREHARAPESSRPARPVWRRARRRCRGRPRPRTRSARACRPPDG